MAAISTIIAGVGLALAAGSAYVNYENSRKQASLASQSLGLQRRQQELENRRANLAANRQRRQLIRQSLTQRANALTAAAGQGALDSSGLYGGLAQVSGQTNTNIMGTNLGQDIGNQLYSLGGAITNVNQQAASAAGNAVTAQGLMSLGGGLIDNSGTIGKFFGEY